MKRLFIIGIIFSLTACDLMSPEAQGCADDKDYLSSTFTEWFKQYLPKKHSMKITGFGNFYELNSSPIVLGTTIYEDLKGGRICKTSANVTITDEKGKSFSGDIDIRYQLNASLPDNEGNYNYGIYMTEYDVNNAKEQLEEKILQEMLRQAFKQHN